MQQQLSLKPAHKIVQEYYKENAEKKQMLLFHEGNVAPAFARLLSRCGAQFGWKLVEQYGAAEITTWDIFYYIYALLHQPAYRQKYAANLKRDLPHLPFVAGVDTFWRYVAAGKRLAELHVHYEDQPEYPLEMIETPPRRWTGGWKRCACQKIRPKSSTTIF